MVNLNQDDSRMKRVLILDATGVFVPFVESIYFPFSDDYRVLIDGNGYLFLNRYKVLFKVKTFVPFDVLLSVRKNPNEKFER